MNPISRFVSWLGQLVDNHFKTLIGLGLIAWGLVALGIVGLPSITIPLWVRVGVTFAAIAAFGGHLLASAYFEAPEPNWNRVIEVNLDSKQWARESKVTDAVLADMTVVGGRLKSPPGTDLYFCRYFNRDAETPVAQCTWKDLPSDAELLGMKPSAIEEEVGQLRDTYEQTHGKYRWVLDHLYGVIRRLDFRRAESQDSVLEEHLTPSMAEESIADVVEDELPDEVLPERVSAVRDDETPDLGTEAIETVEEDLAEHGANEVGTTPTAAPDGGQTDE